MYLILFIYSVILTLKSLILSRYFLNYQIISFQLDISTIILSSSKFFWSDYFKFT